MANENSGDVRAVPGSYGLPLLGWATQSLSFFTHWQAFCNKHRDHYKSTVFKASAGIKAILLLEQESLDTVFNTSLCVKPPGFGPLHPPPDRIGNIWPSILSNNEPHVEKKTFILDQVARRTPQMASIFNELATPYIERWAKAGSFDWEPDLDSLMAEFLSQWFAGVRLDPTDVAEWSAASLVVGPTWLPRPGTAKTVRQLNRMVAAIRAAPGFDEAAEQGADVAHLNADETAKHMLFVLGFNAFAGLQGVIRSLVAELFLNPDWADRAAAEVSEALPEGEEPTLEIMDKTPTLSWIARETMRLRTPVQLIWGIPRHDLVVKSSTGSYAVKKGEVMQGVLAWANRNPQAFENPDTFDPQRFASEEALRNLVWAGGRGVDQPDSVNHICAGQDAVYQTLTLFMVHLLRYRFTLSETPDWGTGISAAGKPETSVKCTSFTRRDDG